MQGLQKCVVVCEPHRADHAPATHREQAQFLPASPAAGLTTLSLESQRKTKAKTKPQLMKMWFPLMTCYRWSSPLSSPFRQALHRAALALPPAETTQFTWTHCPIAKPRGTEWGGKRKPKREKQPEGNKVQPPAQKTSSLSSKTI